MELKRESFIKYFNSFENYQKKHTFVSLKKIVNLKTYSRGFIQENRKR
jgi:hypothetical protein